MLENMISENKMATSRPFWIWIQIWLNEMKIEKTLNNFGSGSDYPIYNSKWVMLKNTISEKQNGDQSAILDLKSDWTENKMATSWPFLI